MTLFGWTIWETAEQKRIRDAQRSIAGSWESIAQTMESVAQAVAEGAKCRPELIALPSGDEPDETEPTLNGSHRRTAKGSRR